MSSTSSPFMTELGDNLSTVRPSSPFFDCNFLDGSRSSGFCFDPSPADQDMPSLGLPPVSVARAKGDVSQAPTARPQAVYARAQDWDNDGVSTLSVEETNATDGTNPNQRPDTIRRINQHSTTSSNTSAANALSPRAKNYSEFHYILYDILEKGQYEDIIDWCEGGMAVLITDIDRFTDEILRDHFGHGHRPIKFSSFKKQLSRYSFYKETRQTHDKTKNFYFCSERFQKGRLDLLRNVHTRIKNKT